MKKSTNVLSKSVLSFSFFFFFRGLSTILLVRHFLFRNVTHAKLLVRCEIFVIVSFVTFSLANILNISYRFPRTIERFEAELLSHTTFLFLLTLQIGVFSKPKLTFSSGDSFSMLKSYKKILFHRVHFNHCTVNKFKIF